MTTDTNLVLVPYWIYQTLKRKNLGIRTLTDYAQMRQVFSIEDLTGLLALQSGANSIVPVSRYYEGRLLNHWMSSAKGAQSVELDSTVIPRSCSDDVRKEAFGRLSEEVDGDESSAYEVISTERGLVFVVLNPKFTKAISSIDEQLEFLRKILKVFYVYQTPKEVAYSSVFSDYVGLLNKSVWGPASLV